MPVERKVVAEDAMVTRVRERLKIQPRGRVADPSHCTDEELFASIASNAIANLSAPETLQEIIDSAAELLLRRKFPDIRKTAVQFAGTDWEYVEAENPRVGFSVGTPSSYVFAVADPLSPEHYLARIGDSAWLTLRDYEKGRLDSLFHRAFLLGRLIEASETRVRHLATITAKLKHDKANREHGRRGGQAERKRTRHETLNRLAAEHERNFRFATNVQALRNAKAFARQHDKEADEPLFHQAGRLLSDEWFKEWLEQFRQKMSQRP